MSINLVKEAYEIITENLDKTTEEVRQALMNEVPVHTGQLKQSIQATKLSKTHARVTVSANHAQVANTGRGAIDLRGTNRYMRFVGYDGKVHYTQYVRGFKGDHYAEKVVAMFK